MVTFPPCKINLGLNIIRKRPDGFHDLVTGFYPVPWTDILEIIPSDKIVFTSSGAVIPGAPQENLCLRAYQLLRRDFPMEAVKIHLHKIIPTGAGLGGGSSDAAFTLRMLNQIFTLNLSTSQLSHYASTLGSDCAFFMEDVPKLGTGRGEVLKDLNISLKGKFIVLIKPDVHISTAEAYAGIHPLQPSKDLPQILEHHPLHEWKNLVKNDFEELIFKKYPLLDNIKKKLYTQGALYASMSGSGSAVFGIFENEVNADSQPGIHWSSWL
jgi:4-diphosphocytidyl-2-C-methyl-D-erythritol kinase